MPLKQTDEPHKPLEMSELFRNDNGGLRRPPSSRDFIAFGTTLSFLGSKLQIIKLKWKHELMEKGLKNTFCTKKEMVLP